MPNGYDCQRTRFVVADLNWLERYQAGECEAVWGEMIRLGVQIHEEPNLAEALRVCDEFTRRSKQNLKKLFLRLHEIGYEFSARRDADPARMSEQGFFRLTADESRAPWRRPEVWKINGWIDPNARRTHGYPLVVEQWMEAIGEIDLRGLHPALSPQYQGWAHPRVFPDPFHVCEYVEEGGPGYVQSRLWISDHDVEKSLLLEETDGSCEWYYLELPCSAIDARMYVIWYPTTFTGYVRKNFQWGGFPGWERYPAERPDEILEFLREGLLPV